MKSSRDAYLTRDTLPRTAFAIPERRAWPIHNQRHALIALRYMREGKGDRKDYPRIRRAIAARYPGLKMTSREGRGTARDIQVIISEGTNKPSPRPYPKRKKSHRSPFQARFRRPFKKAQRGRFLPKRRLPLGTRPFVVGGPQRDPGKKVRKPRGLFKKTIYRECPCGETAHGYQEREGDNVLVYACRNCRKTIKVKPGWLKPNVSRDFSGELRHLSIQALGRLLRVAIRNGDESKCQLIEREIDRRDRMKGNRRR